MRRLQVVAIPFVATLAVACSGGGGSNEPAPPSLTVAPTEWSVPAGGAPKQFAATLTGSSDPIVWSIETSGTADEVGTLSTTGLYTPSPSLAVGRDVVVDATAGTLVARATVHVGAAVDGVTLTVSPPTGSVVAGSGGTVALHADTSYAGTVTWTIVPDIGTLDSTSGADVTYTAPAGLVTATTDVVVTATAGALSDATTLTVQPTVLQVTGPATVRAGGAPVAFVLVTNVGANTVAWSVVPASAGTISGTASVGTFTPAPSVAADTPFQVVAAVGEATGSASAILLPQVVIPGSVVGRVVDERGVGYVGANVVIGAQSATTGADGAFTILAVSPPYDVAVIAESNKNVTVFRGVSDTTPVLPFTRSLLDPLRSATISGTVTFQPSPQQAPIGIYADVFGPADRTSSSLVDGSYTLLSHWSGSSPATLTHRAIYVSSDPTTHLADGYLYGARTAEVTEGGTLTGQDIALSLVDYGSVTGTVVSGADHDLETYLFAIGGYFTDGVSRTLISYTAYDWWAPYGAFDVVVPVLPDGTVRLGARAAGTAGGSANASAPVVPGQTGVSLVLPWIPRSIAPDSGTPGIRYTTAFTWDTIETGGTDALDLDCTNGVSYRIWGGGRSATIPDLSAHGITLAPDYTSCTWYPRWVSYAMGELVQGPAAVDALPVKRTAYGAQRSFIF